jgi:ecotin
MINSIKSFVFITAFLLIARVFAADLIHPELKAFPDAKEGMQRHVIVLPHKERGEDNSFKVEIVAGKTMLTDGVNKIRLANTIEPQPLKGWGYTYYEVTGKGLAMSTMMAAPEGSSQVESFVSGKPILIAYNSRLPVVIYSPSGYEIRYRVWRTTDEFEKADKD